MSTLHNKTNRKNKIKQVRLDYIYSLGVSVNEALKEIVKLKEEVC